MLLLLLLVLARRLLLRLVEVFDVTSVLVLGRVVLLFLQSCCQN